MLKTRSQAALILDQVINHQKSLDSQFNSLHSYSLQDQAFIKNICFGTLRHYFSLNAVSKLLLKKNLPRSAAIVQVLLLSGFYQLHSMRIPNYAAVSECVEACKELKQIPFTGLVNKVLKIFAEKSQKLLQEACAKNYEAQYDHPEWLINTIKKQYPEKWPAILKANNTQPPLWLRINAQTVTPQKFCELLTAAAIEFEHPQEWSIRILEPCPVEHIPGFNEGYFWVQDLAGQKLADYVHLNSGMRILDACAAPGSKTALFLAQQNDLHLTALDIDAGRLKRIAENLTRLKLFSPNVHLKPTDATQLESWWDGKLFDYILIDAPCSGSGVIRRHPDIKLLRRSSDIAAFAKKQFKLLSTLLPLLKKDGRLIYTTCSILKEENEQVVQKFFEKCPIQYTTLLPEINQTDGFFYAEFKSV